MSNFTLKAQDANFGDDYDMRAVHHASDYDAAIRLLRRWLEPTPSVDVLRALPVPHVTELIRQVNRAIYASIQAQQNAQAPDGGEQ
jgi:hypothetical protein